MQEQELRDFLLDSGLVSRSQLQSAELRMSAQGVSLSRALLESGILSEEEVRRAASHALGIPYVVLAPQSIDPEALTLIPEPLSRTRNAVAFAVSERGVEVALLDIEDLSALDFLAGRMRVLPRLASRESLRQALLLYQKLLKDKFDGSAQALLSHAASQGASTIHIDPADAVLNIRYRLGGVLHKAMTLSPQRGERLTRELKRLKGLRLFTMPTVFGEKIVIHLLHEKEGQKGFTLEALGFHGASQELLEHALRQKKGLIAIIGTGGSGVTTTLYTFLDMLSHTSRSIVSLERQIEHRLPQVAQIQAGHLQGLSDTAALRGALRQDPDVVALSDIEEEAALALAARAGGHALVLLSMREESRGAGGAAMVVRQRLVRRVCPTCSVAHTLSRSETRQLEEHADFAKVLAALREENIVTAQTAWKDVQFRRAEGCSRCSGGYRGFIGVQEVTPHEGEVPLNLAEDALFKAAGGLTSIEEVLAVAGSGAR